ncbi:MAG: ABC transporter substrate-binding protein [Pseudobacteriovorax sp.]|nr:ABC transporter substrate-binding protein [Pseudobacteriovorax sp.]
MTLVLRTFLILGLFIFCKSALAIDAKLKIGVVLPRTGAMSPIGEELQRGITVAFNRIKSNPKSRIAKNLQIVFVDDKGTSEGAIKATEELILRHRVHAIIGSVSNSINDTISDIVASRQKTMVLPIASREILAKSKNFFSVATDFETQGKNLGTFASSRIKSNKIFIIVRKDEPEERLLADAFSKGYKARSGKSPETLEVESFESVDASIARRMQNAAVFIPASISESAPLLQRFEGKSSPKIIGSELWETAVPPNAIVDGGLEVYYHAPYSIGSPHSALQAFVSSFKDAYNKQPSSIAFAGYESFNTIVYAYTRVKSNRTSPIVQYLKSAKKLPSLSGPASIGPSRFSRKPISVETFTKSGPKYVTKIGP